MSPGRISMTATSDGFSAWLADAQISEPRLKPQQRSVLLAAFAFRQSQGDDYYSTRLLGRTRYAGAFLMLGPAVGWLATAQQCFADEFGSLTRGLLTSAFAPVVGLERLWHLDEMEDAGFALLTGGRRCPSRHTIGGWRRHLRWYEVDAFCRRTCPWHLVQRDDALVSFDEHTIPRWT